MAKFYLTTPIYYANAKPHVGHAFATLSADVLARYRRARGVEVFFLAGLDEHGSKMAEAAAAAGQPPQRFADEQAAAFVAVWRSLNITNDDFIRTTSDRHRRGVLALIERLQAAGALYEGEYKGLYCVGCEKFLIERDLDAKGECPLHRRRPEQISERNWFFDLKKYLPAVAELITSNQLIITPASRRQEVLQMIKDGVPDFSISREKVAWGIPFPGDPDQTVYVWADALSNYITALDYPDGAKFKQFWPADLHLIGAEINKFHSLYWPAMLLAAGIAPPKRILVHGLFTVNGQKMSKSLGNAVDPLTMVARFGADATRYLLLSQFPADRHGDLKEEGFAAQYEADLAKGVGNLLARSYALIRAASDRPTAGTAAPVLVKEIDQLTADYDRAMDDCRLFEALQTARALVTRLDRYIEESRPWETANRPAVQTAVLATLERGARSVIQLFQPFMPEQMAAADRAFTDYQAAKLTLFPRLEPPAATR